MGKCKTCGMPYCVCQLKSHVQKMKVVLVRGGTAILWVNPDTKETARRLKKNFGTGGRVTEKNQIILQGDQRGRLRRLLMRLGCCSRDLETIFHPPLPFFYF